jgi:vacuolar-type H+-ATPase subunit I/STV1
MSRALGRGSGYELHMIHNVRPAVEFSGSPRRPALIMTLSILIGLATLLIFVLKG